MIWFIIIPVLLVFLWSRLTKKYVNPYRLTFVFGKKGSGKSTLLTKIAVKAVSAGRLVFCNDRTIKGTIYFNPIEIGKKNFPPESIVLIDEVSLIWSNRDWKKTPPELIQWFRFQRKYHVKVYLFSQSFDIDLKLRELRDDMYLVKNYMRIFSVRRAIDKAPAVYPGQANAPSTIGDNLSFRPLLLSGSVRCTFVPRWTGYFKSFDRPVLPFFSTAPNGELPRKPSFREVLLQTGVNLKSWCLALPETLRSRFSDYRARSARSARRFRHKK